MAASKNERDTFSIAKKGSFTPGSWVRRKIDDHVVGKVVSLHHHGIVECNDGVGGDNFVIGLTDSGKVHREPLDNTFELYKDASESEYHSKDIVLRAQGKLNCHLGYNAVTNNCEGFCNWCYFNKNTSNQTRTAAISTGTAASLGASTGAAVYCSTYGVVTTVIPASGFWSYVGLGTATVVTSPAWAPICTAAAGAGVVAAVVSYKTMKD
mmetsp:Transcript_47522/g.61030  ORF Transcript_47522/g.61030 Transcript_47522/m.61030 type:complete len:210 (+) Transcript_47522:52-681(+)|eukprot:CAMPEP_0114347112 /NCGR_PEP_ID=MMETSP0101-20121206/13629_1 /TAXON_ID=38822 ORGANISM="Pteridomonas danica, Strain PT" /NCGR_SAMPLE_ID=MMETSP0101 /ASSEMBLY_ACC=CAM_ASM_000211 /LENGTH=209 /DNA_ID=CAMNT_0001484205 /DNA_START=22 /DNA_END=651 /DNA_ORIENTATION=+